MEVLLMAVMAASNILCFLIGAKVGQRVVKGEEVEIPTLNPMEIYWTQQERKEAERVKDKMDTILRNIDNYDGTPNGQEEVR